MSDQLLIDPPPRTDRVGPCMGRPFGKRDSVPRKRRPPTTGLPWRKVSGLPLRPMERSRITEMAEGLGLSVSATTRGLISLGFSLASVTGRDAVVRAAKAGIDVET